MEPTVYARLKRLATYFAGQVACAALLIKLDRHRTFMIAE